MKKQLESILLQVSKSNIIDKGNLDQSIRSVLDSAIVGLNIKRAGVWFLEENSSAIQCKLLKDVANNIESDDLRLTESDFPKYFSALKTERTIIADNAQTDINTAEFTESYLKPLSIESMLDVPIRHNGVMVGIICCEHIGPARQWSEDEATFAAALADLVGRAINAHNYQKTADRLELINQELERRVKQRTQELELALNNLKNTQNQLIESEKMAALGGLVSGVAHEVNTPLGVSITAISHLELELNNIIDLYEDGKLDEKAFITFIGDSKEAISILSTNINRAAKLVKDFKMTAVNQSQDSLRKFPIYLNIEALISSLHPVTKAKKTIINLNCPKDLIALTHPGALSQTLTNLIMNSMTHAFDKQDVPKIDIIVSLINETIKLEFKDNGCGIRKENLKKVFEPFFTTNRTKGGTGLGLSILYNLVTQKLMGHVDVQSELGQGTIFTLTFPRVLRRNNKDIAQNQDIYQVDLV